MTWLSFYSRRAAVTAAVLMGGCVLVTPTSSHAAQREIDAFMEQVLEKRDENWITLQDYVLDEVETFEVLGPIGIPLQGSHREYSWYVRDGYLVRSPVRVDGVEISEGERREYESDWLREERRRVVRPRRRRRWSRRTTFENVMRSVEREWGQRVSDDVGRTLTADAEARDDAFAAIVTGTESIVIELGGIDQLGFGLVAERTRDAFVMLEDNRLKDDDVSQLLTKMLPRLVGALGVANEGELDQFVELVELASRFDIDISGSTGVLDQAQRALAGRGLETRVAALENARHPAPERDREGGSTPDTLSSSLQPRFVSESYFLDFEFESGNYYFAGREQLADREVVKIEYYPEQMFSDDESIADSDDPEGRVEAGFDKTSLVTLWVDPQEHQIVKFTFDNLGFDFLPGRWLMRLDDLNASMVMSQPLKGIWLPETVELVGQVTLAVGTFTVRYTRVFSNYREAEGTARIRSYVTPRD